MSKEVPTATPFRCVNCNHIFSVSATGKGETLTIEANAGICPKCRGYGAPTTMKEINLIKGNPYTLKQLREQVDILTSKVASLEKGNLSLKENQEYQSLEQRVKNLEPIRRNIHLGRGRRSGRSRSGASNAPT